MKTILFTTMAAALIGITARADETTDAPTNAPVDSAIENANASTNTPATSAPTADMPAPSVTANANLGSSSASSPPPDVSGSTSYLDRKFEAGAIFGEPTGASLKYWLNDTMAVDGALGWSFDSDTDFYIHSDLLWHKFDVFKVSKGELPLYFGAGGLVKLRDNRDDIVGVRIPVGVNYLFEDVPVSLFLEVAPVLRVAPSTRGDFTAGIGARYRF